MPPIISVVLPVRDGADLLGRAVASVLRQTLPDWELLVVDDGSADATPDAVARATAADPRVRAFRHPAGRGVSAARNTALAHARGDLVAYLDHDDAFHPDYLANARATGRTADLVLCRYDVAEGRPGHPLCGRSYVYDPAIRAAAFPRETTAVPLGVCHRWAALARVGGFDEMLRRDEDGDLWRRMAQAGASVGYAGHRSGVYHARAGSLSRVVPAGDARLVDAPFGGPGGPPVRVPAGGAWRVPGAATGARYGRFPPGVVGPAPVVVDVGAGVGLFARYAVARWPGAVVHAFEPYPPAAALFRHNLAGVPGASVRPIALGPGDGTAALRLHPTDGGRNSFRADRVPRPAGRLPTPVRHAGRAWDGLGRGGADVLHLDCGGAEADVLAALGPRLAGVRAILAGYRTPDERAQAAALLAGHRLVWDAGPAAGGEGLAAYARADLAPPGPG